MKEGLSLFTFGIWALFFVVFFTALKPDTVAVVARSNKPEYCNRDASPAHHCPLYVFAAISGTNVRQRK